jgi:hypothetical protein
MINTPLVLTPIVSSSHVVDSPFSVPSNEDFVPSFIVQLNCHNSRATTYSILNSEPVSTLILLLQEPWINPLTCLPPDHEGWWTFYSFDHSPKNLQDKHRVVSYIRKAVASRDIRVLAGNSKFPLAVELTFQHGPRIRAINLYNQPGTTSGIDQLGEWLGQNNNRRIATMIGMDANLHHHLWNPPGYSHVHKAAKSLVALCGRSGFRLVSEKDCPTFISSRGSRTTIDLTWANFAASWLISRTIMAPTTRSLSLPSDKLPPSPFFV